MTDRRKQLLTLFHVYGKKCFYCDKRVKPCASGSNSVSDSTATRDHLIPLTRGGKRTQVNMVLACFQCNQEKANRMPIGFLVEKMKERS